MVYVMKRKKQIIKYRIKKGVLKPLLEIMTQTELRKTLQFRNKDHFLKCLGHGKPIGTKRRRWILEIYEQMLGRRPDFDKIFEVKN